MVLLTFFGFGMRMELIVCEDDEGEGVGFLFIIISGIAPSWMGWKVLFSMYVPMEDAHELRCVIIEIPDVRLSQRTIFFYWSTTSYIYIAKLGRTTFTNEHHKI